MVTVKRSVLILLVLCAINAGGLLVLWLLRLQSDNPWVMP